MCVVVFSFVSMKKIAFLLFLFFVFLYLFFCICFFVFCFLFFGVFVFGVPSQKFQSGDHFVVPLACDDACGVCSDELCCESEKFVVGVLANVCDDFRFSVCGVGVSGVSNCAFNPYLAEGFKFVGVADNVADEGVVWRQEFVVVQWFAGTHCVVFRAVGYVLDDLFDFSVVADVFVAEFVEFLFKCPFLVLVFVVGDVV